MSAPALLPLPCPFCGVEEVTMMHDARVLFWVECFHCNGRTNEHMPTEAEAVAAWNRRAEPSAWQDIALAPKDGSKQLVGHDSADWRHLAEWRRPKNTEAGCEDDCCCEKWIVDDDNEDGFVFWVEPTHYLPLPVLPAAPKVS